jgi:hypothetical protein
MVPDGIFYKGNNMYKRVTHTITEEHFGHAMAAEIKKVVDKTIVPPKLKMEPAAASKVKADISEYLNSFNKGLLEIYRSIDSPDNIGLNDAETGLFSTIDNLGNLFKTYYGIEFGERINQSQRSLVFCLIAIARNIKNKIDIRDWKQRLEGIRNDISSMLYQYNNFWRYADNIGTLSQLYDEYISLMQNIANRNQTGTDASINKINNLTSAFESNMVNGLLQQFPDKFIA